ncbi:hypothetical protein O0L34_g4882 [Tuta absoluta]|nr:hypothetical protein O0L34_g4882 [Tuta absoluta]
MLAVMVAVTLVSAACAGRLDQLAFSQSSAYASASASASASSSSFSRNAAVGTPFRYENQVNNGDGNYRYSYDANGISAHESGSPRAPGPEGPAVTSEGGYSYRAPDGQQISLTYTADENGFHPVGSHLPTPPPIPDAILRSIEYNRQHPSNDDGSYNRGRAGYQY